MNHPAYPYEINSGTRYSFISTGKLVIEKVVEFSPTAIPHVYNLGFGDLCADGTIDDSINSNNGDIVKVLATVIRIVGAFTLLKPHIKVVFTGSTPDRLRLYQRILRMYYFEFVTDFLITGLVKEKRLYKELIFKPEAPNLYLAFFVQRIY
ncbi:hypothetical protein LQ567_08155 [Niabella pedocola]|uniref:Uncharacterized protein n=1 Tax=Niabella pedocola TaxID=1752077 RepID=A0ABS8PNP8_9BACT|nr:hypothetical protein [Niabella pedocola]MCD2422730.1 hypothetical protein [Niabella pedocola]